MGNLLSSNTPAVVPYPRRFSSSSSLDQSRDSCDTLYPYCGCEYCDGRSYNNSNVTIPAQSSYGFNDDYYDYSPEPPRRPYSPRIQYLTSPLVTSSASRIPANSVRSSEPRTQPQITSRQSISTNYGQSAQPVRYSNISTVPTRRNISPPRGQELTRVAPTITQTQIRTSLRSNITPSNSTRSTTTSSIQSLAIRSPDRRIEINRTSLPSTSRSRPAIPDFFPTNASSINRPVLKSTSSNVPKSTEVSSTSKETWPSYLFDESVDEVSNMLECSICLDLCSGRIIQCKNGHNICETHTSQVSICPICRVSYNEGSSRNLLAEKLIVQEKSKIEMKEQQQKLFDNVAKLSVNKASIKNGAMISNTKPPEPDKPCRYAWDGCAYMGDNRRLQAHQSFCDFRPIECCFETDRCHNAQVSFSRYIEHLKTVHKVRTFGEEAQVKFYLGRGRKLARDGSSSMAIMEGPLGTDNFIMRAVQFDDEVVIWISIHGNRQSAYRFKSELKLDNHGNRNKNDPLHRSEEFRLGTSRDTVLTTPAYLSIPVDYLETNLREEGGRRNYVKEFWSVTAKIRISDGF